MHPPSPVSELIFDTVGVAVERSPPSDEQLLEAIARHQVWALEEIYERHAQTVYNLIMRIVHEPTTAEALLQETFWQVWQKAGDFEGSGVAAAWLYRIARNKSLDQLRRQRARPQATEKSVEEYTALSELLANPGLTPVEEAVERHESAQALRDALGQLPNDQRQCLELAYFEGLSQSQIAALTNTPLGTIKTRVRVGLQKLERILRTAGYQATDL